MKNVIFILCFIGFSVCTLAQQRVQNQNYQTVGYLPNVDKKWAAAFFFFFFTKNLEE